MDITDTTRKHLMGRHSSHVAPLPMSSNEWSYPMEPAQHAAMPPIRARLPPGSQGSEQAEEEHAMQPPGTPSLANYRRSGEDLRLFVWGRGDLGQLGTGSTASSSSPAVLDALQGKMVTHIAAGVFNTAYLTSDGELYTTGDNELGQLGTSSVDGQRLEPQRVQALETSTLVHMSVGLGHMVAVTDKGSLASWGGAEFGQLGHGPMGVSSPQPRLIRGTRDVHFAQVACGACHTLALTTNGQVFSFGQGTFGALGHGDDRNFDFPTPIQKLWAVGVVQVAAGENHSAALALDGQVYTWGRGKYGQLGLGDFYSKQVPSHVKALSGTLGVQIACGGDHVLLLSRRGELYSWGRGTWGQTGLGSTDNTCLPRKIESLAGRWIVQVAAGGRHSLALEASGVLFACGNSEEGQLGTALPPVGSPSVQLSPKPVAGISSPELQPRYVVAGGDFSAFVAATGQGRPLTASATIPLAFSANGSGLGVSPVQLPNLLDLADAATSSNGAEPPQRAVQAMVHAVEAVFSSPGYLIGGFMTPKGSGGSSKAGSSAMEADDDSLDHCLDMGAVKQVYRSILHTYNSEVILALSTSLTVLLDGFDRAVQSPHSSPQADWLKALLIVAQNPVMGDSKHGLGLAMRFASVVCSLTSPSQQVLLEWLASFSREDFAVRLVRPVQKHVSVLCASQASMRQARPELLQLMQLLDVLHEVNESANELIGYEEFHNKEVSENANLREEYMLCIDMGVASRGPIKSLCQVPFIFTPEAKSRILQGEANLQKRHMVQNSNFQALLSGLHPAQLVWLHIKVSRENLLGDALNEIVTKPQDLKKPLKVTFVSAGVVEEGLDEGGVAREFFMLLTKELLDLKYGMFTYISETRTFWFNQCSVEPDINFRLVGILLGLAIYNNVILDLHFPMVVYKKLLGQAPSFEDLKAMMPDLGRGLQQLLDFGGDVEDVFARNFEVEYECFGEMQKLELLKGGSEIPVTNDNRQQYVDLYMQWLLKDSVSRHFQAFADGFHEVCGGPALRLFRHEELELLICGLPHLDFEALESVTRYDGGYSNNSPAIKLFWEVLHSLTLEQKKRFLLFTTGCDRAPVGGLGQLPLILQRSGPDTDRLPTSHTCFHILLLPEYSTREKMLERLLTAINNAEGFGLQ